MKLKEKTIHEFKLVYSACFNGSLDVLDSTVLLLGDNGLSKSSSELPSLVLRAQKEAKEELASVLNNWSFDRLSIVDRSIIFFAIAKIKYRSEPLNRAISEAVELARLFSEKKSAKFINGVLDAWYNKYQKEA